MLLREYLQAKGYAAELYPDGEAGYKAFLKNKYDLCVFDVMMPKKDGFTLAQEVRAANAAFFVLLATDTSQDSFNSESQLFHTERFGDIIVRTVFKTFQNIFFQGFPEE